MSTRNSEGVRSLMPLYEGNYQRLLRLVPGLHSIRVPTTLILSELPQIRLTVIECCRYTTTVVLAHCLTGTGGLVPDLTMKIRICHDARVAEVIGYQNQARFAPLYAYPNTKMHQRFEKRQVNRFLDEWLKYCGVHGHQFERLPGCSSA